LSSKKVRNAIPWPAFLRWCAAVNYGIPSGLGCLSVFAHDAMYRLHCRWFDPSVTRFDELTCGLFDPYKLAIWFFLLIPGWC
jgi:hypothetical protein